MYEVYVMPVVMLGKVNVRMTMYVPHVYVSVLFVTVAVVVTVTNPCIGFSAGVFAGIRIPSAARVTQMITRALIASCLFKSVPSRCWACRRI
jgi:hypothetical protein